MTHSHLPWRIDKDNGEAIEIISADGDLVHIEKYSDIPSEFDAETRNRLIAKARANAYFILNAANQCA